MLEKLSEIEAVIETLERSAPKLVEIGFFEKILHLRGLAVNHWKLADPDQLDTEATLHIRDRIIFLEQRMLDLVACAPAYTADGMKLKLKLLMLELGLSEDIVDGEDPSENLIKSLFQDLTFHAENCHSVEKSRDHLKSVS